MPTLPEQPARPGRDHVRHGRVENILHLRIGRQKTLQDRKHLVQLRRIGAEKPEQVPEKKQPGRERKEKLIRHLRGQTHGVVRRRFPDQAPRDPADEFEASHLRAEFTLPRHKYPLNSRTPDPANRAPANVKSGPAAP